MLHIRIATAAAALLAAPFAGSASAATCAPDFGPIACPVQAEAQVPVGQSRSCIHLGNDNYNCRVVWLFSWSAQAVTPGVATIAVDGDPREAYCDWVTGGCTGSALQYGGTVAMFRGDECTTATSTVTFSVTGTSTFGQATDTKTASYTVTNDPRWWCP